MELYHLSMTVNDLNHYIIYAGIELKSVRAHHALISTISCPNHFVPKPALRVAGELRITGPVFHIAYYFILYFTSLF